MVDETQSSSNWPDLTWSIATEDDASEVVDFLLENFFPDEPINNFLSLDIRKEVKPWLPSLVGPQLRRGVSIVVRESASNRIAAVSFNDVVRQEEIGHLDMTSVVEENQFDCPTMWRVVCFLENLSADLDLFKQYSVGIIGSIDILCVAPEHRGRRLGCHVIQLSLDRMEELGYPMVATKATSYFSMRTLQKLGFSTLRRIRYDWPVNLNNLELHQIHKEACLMLRRL